jgi:hypothetical protein
VAAGGLSRRARILIVLGVLLVLAGLVGGAWWSVYTRPFADDEEIAAIAEDTTRMVLAAEAERCPRPVLRGEAVAGSGQPALRAILDGRPDHADCWTFLDRENERVAALVSTVEGWPADPDAVQPTPTGIPPLAEGWLSVVMGSPVRATPVPLEQEALAACGATVRAIRDSIAHEDVCGPYGLTTSMDQLLLPVVRIARLFPLLARERIRAGDLRGAAEVLLDGIRFGHDLARGPASLLPAMISCAVIAIMVGQLQGLLAQDLGWNDETLVALQAQVETLVQTLPSSDRAARQDPWTVLVWTLPALGWEPPIPIPRSPLPASSGFSLLPEEESWRMLAVASRNNADRLDAGRCGAGVHGQACLAAIDGLVAGLPPDPGDLPWWVEVLGPRSGRELMLEQTYRQLVESLAPYVRRIELGQLEVRALWLVLEHRRRTLGGVPCPTAAAFASAHGPVPTERGMGGHFEILESALDHQPLEVGAPHWMRPLRERRPRVRLPLAQLYCPAFAVP